MLYCNLYVNTSNHCELYFVINGEIDLCTYLLFDDLLWFFYMFMLSQFDQLLRRKWDDAMARGYFRYDLTNLQTRLIPGRNQYVLQVMFLNSLHWLNVCILSFSKASPAWRLLDALIQVVWALAVGTTVIISLLRFMIASPWSSD